MKLSLKYLVSILFILATVCIVFVSNSVLAQTSLVSVNTVTITTSPESPAPNEAIEAKLSSYSIDIDSSNITWVVDGKKVKSGIGISSITLTAPAIGKSMTISVTVSSPSGQTLSNSVTIKSGSLDFIVEPSGYVPPFFLGKFVPVYQNSVKITAIPHITDKSGAEYLPTKLVYKWSKDSGQVLTDQSGYGKQSITLEGNIIPRPYVLKLEVTNQDGSAAITNSFVVFADAPNILFYENDPLYGPLYNQSLGDTVSMGDKKELSILAVPYGFDKLRDSLDDLILKWSINGIEKPELGSSNVVVLRSKDGESGASSLNLNISTPKKILQSSLNNITVTFNNTTQSNTQTENVAF